MGQDGLICDDVGWESGIKKAGNIIYNVDIGLWEILEGMGPNNQSVPAHGSKIGSSIIVVDGESFT